jgi:two-component system sensor histidine kinase FlrB
MEAGAKCIKIALRQREHELTVQVSDDGPGFAADQTGHMLEAFYTTKSHGTGLGLAVVQAVVKAHQGSFDINSPATGGAVATLALPLLRASSIDGHVTNKQNNRK